MLSEELSSRSIVSGIENKLYIRRLRSKPIFKKSPGEGKKYSPKFFWVRRLMVNHWSPKPGLQVRFLPDPQNHNSPTFIVGPLWFMGNLRKESKDGIARPVDDEALSRGRGYLDFCEQGEAKDLVTRDRFLSDPHPIILKIVQRFVQFFWLASTQTTQFACHA